MDNIKKLELTYPSRPFIIYQKFGESSACAEDRDVPVTQRKVKTKINGVCPVGYIELYPLLGMKGHTGLDLYATRGTILRSPIKGKITELQTEPERGLGVGIVSDEKYDMGEYGVHYAKIRQWHLMSIHVEMGQEVEIGDPIGLADSTGLSSGDHNHFELKPVEYTSRGITKNVYQDNGYYGSIDPLPFFNSRYADEYKRYEFNKTMRYGERSEDVKRMQEKLKELGYFTFHTATGYYGRITQNAVYAFQLDKVPLSWYEKYVMKGSVAGPKTRAELSII